MNQEINGIRLEMKIPNDVMSAHNKAQKTVLLKECILKYNLYRMEVKNTRSW